MSSNRKKPVSEKSKALRRKRLLSVFIPVIACTLVLVAGLCVLGDYLIHKPLNAAETGSTSRQELVSVPNALKQKQINVLIAGIDSGTARSTNLTDTMMVAHFDLENKQINVLQIPRDTYVDEAVWTGKINAVYNVGRENAYGKGINGLINCVSGEFKIHIDYYALVNLDGFRDIVQAMGGVKINLPEALTLEVDEKTYTFPKGEQVLTPKLAEVFVRERNSRGGDLGRVQKGQRVFLSALIKQIKSMSKSQMVSMVPTLFKYVKTDISLADATSLVYAALDIDTSKINFSMVPGEGAYINGQSCYSVHLAPLVKILNEKFRIGMDPIVASDLGLQEVKNTTNYYDDTDGANVDDVNGDTTEASSKS